MAIEVGKRYGYRKQRYAIGQALRPVLVTKEGPPKSYKYRIRWLDGEYEGLDEWVRRETLLCPWEEAPAYVEDEIRLARAVEASAGTYKTPEWEAVREVFWEVESPFELAEWVRYHGTVVLSDFPASLADTGYTPEELMAAPHAFVDRDGMYVAPFSTALQIAKRYCTQHPERIIAQIKQQVQAYSKAAQTGWYASPQGRYGHDISLETAKKLMEEQQAIEKILSDWCGKEHSEKFDLTAGLQEEVTRLRQLLTETLNWMRDTAEEQNLRWLKTKYVNLYKQLNGEAPPVLKRRKRSANNAPPPVPM